MTIKQYSDIQRCLGKLEGIGASLPNDVAPFFFDTLEVLDALILEAVPEVLFTLLGGVAPKEEKEDGG